MYRAAVAFLASSVHFVACVLLSRAPISSGSSSSAPKALTLLLLALEEYNYLHSNNPKCMFCRAHRWVCSHLLFGASLGEGMVHPPLVTAAFCPDPKALRADVRWCWGSFQNPAGVYGAPCVPSGFPLGHPYLQSSSGDSGNVHGSTSPFPCNPSLRTSVPHSCVWLILHFQSDTWEFQLFCWEFHLPAKLFACRVGAESAFGSFPLQTFVEGAECWRLAVTLQLSGAPCVVLHPYPLWNL